MKAVYRFEAWYVQVALVIGCVACAPKEASLGNDSAGGAGGQTSVANGGAAGLQSAVAGNVGTLPNETGGAAGSTYPAELVTDASVGWANKAYQGGYVHTFVDRSGKSSILPYTGKLNPLDTTTIPALVAPAMQQGNGIDGGEPGNLAFHVTGSVGMDPPYDSLVDDDRYWDQLFGTRCLNQTCQQMLWPEAGLQIGLQAHHQPTDLSHYLGVGFRLRAGVAHGLDENTGAAIPIAFEAPMDTTDIPDPTLLDEFGPVVNGRQVPSCRFPGSDRGDGQPAGATGYTCLLHFTAQVVPSAEYQNLCIAWPELQPPASPADNLANAGITQLDPMRIVSFRWKVRGASCCQTTAGSVPPTNAFDFWLDDVWLLTCENWAAHCLGKALPAACQ